MASLKRAPFLAALSIFALSLSACGLGRDQSSDNGTVRNPIVAATVNGRPIYVEDVRAHAAARGLAQDGQDLATNSDAFYFALEELIQVRLFSMEAEARGLDRQPEVARQLENAREQVLANAIYEEIDARATNSQAIQRLYNENTNRLGEGQEVHLRHIQFDTREAADAAKRRLDRGERFEALAFELSTDRDSAADGGDMDWGAVGDLNAGFRQAIEHANVGDLIGPLQINGKWELIRVEDRRERGSQSLEALRPRIVTWLRFQEITRLQERLERNARIERNPDIERMRETQPETTTAPNTTQSQTPPPPSAHMAPDVTAPPGQNPPPFPFPMGPGGVTGSPSQQSQAPPPSHVTAPVVAPPARGGASTTTTTTTNAGPSQ